MGQGVNLAKKNSSLKCWLFLPIFVADKKIISHYDFVALSKSKHLFKYV